MARHCLNETHPLHWRVPRAAIRARQPHRVHQGAQHMPQMAQLVEIMRFQVYGAAPAAVRA